MQPLWRGLVDLFPQLSECMGNLQANRTHFAALFEQAEAEKTSAAAAAVAAAGAAAAAAASSADNVAATDTETASLSPERKHSDDSISPGSVQPVIYLPPAYSSDSSESDSDTDDLQVMQG